MAGYKAIEKLLSDLKKQRRMINIELCRMPEGKLMISSNGSRLSCFDIGSPNSRKNPKGIGRDKERVCKLARKAYLQEELERIEINIRQLEHALARCVPLDETDLLKSMPKHFDTLDVRYLVNPAVQNIGKWPNPSRDPSVKPGCIKTASDIFQNPKTLQLTDIWKTKGREKQDNLFFIQTYR